MTGSTLCASNHSTIALEHGAQQACSSTFVQPSGIMMTLVLDICSKFAAKVRQFFEMYKIYCEKLAHVAFLSYLCGMKRRIYVFDLGGVLIKLNVGRCMRAFEALMGEANMRAVLGMDAHGEGLKAVSIATKQLMADFERGLISPENFLTEVQAFCRPDTTKEAITEAWMAMLDELPAERLASVDALRAKGHKVYLLSNGNDLHFEFINRTYGLNTHFDGMFLSQKMHMAKPEEPIFRAVDDAIRVEAVTEVFFIDDIETNRLAAETFVRWTTFSSLSEVAKIYE